MRSRYGDASIWRTTSSLPKPVPPVNTKCRPLKRGLVVHFQKSQVVHSQYQRATPADGSGECRCMQYIGLDLSQHPWQQELVSDEHSSPGTQLYRVDMYVWAVCQLLVFIGTPGN